MYGRPKNVCCVCDPSVHLDVPSICFVCVFVCFCISFKSLRAGPLVFSLLMLFLCIIRILWTHSRRVPASTSAQTVARHHITSSISSFVNPTRQH